MLDWHSCQTCYPLEKQLLLLFYYVRLKPACAATEKLIRGLKFWIQKLEILYNNKGADQIAQMLFAYGIIRFSHDVAQIMIIQRNTKMKIFRNRSRLL